MEWRLFADLADTMGTRRVTQSVPDASEYTVDDAMTDLLDANPELRERLYDDDGELYEHINILKNGVDISNKNGMGTRITDDDEVAIFPPVSGG